MGTPPRPFMIGPSRITVVTIHVPCGEPVTSGAHRGPTRKAYPSQEDVMSERERRERLRSPEQRVGTLTNGALPPPSDEDLLWRALVEGEEAALGQALDRMTPSMVRLAMYHVRSRADAEDVVQETWLGALHGVARFEHRSSLRTWLYRILKNRARTSGARLARMVTFTDLEAAAPGGDSLRDVATDAAAEVHRVPAPERDLIARELGERIQRAIATLPVRQREVVTMRDVEGRSAREVRELLGLTDANQRVLLHRARTRIRDQLSDDDGGASGSMRRLRRSMRGPTRVHAAARTSSFLSCIDLAV